MWIIVLDGEMDLHEDIYHFAELIKQPNVKIISRPIDTPRSLHSSSARVVLDIIIGY